MFVDIVCAGGYKSANRLFTNSSILGFLWLPQLHGIGTYFSVLFKKIYL
jgi:hypothetical protein